MNRDALITVTINTMKGLFIKSMLFFACISSVLYIETQFTDDDSHKNSCNTRPEQSEVKHDKTSKEDCFF